MIKLFFSLDEILQYNIKNVPKQFERAYWYEPSEMIIFTCETSIRDKMFFLMNLSSDNPTNVISSLSEIVSFVNLRKGVFRPESHFMKALKEIKTKFPECIL